MIEKEIYDKDLDDNSVRVFPRSRRTFLYQIGQVFEKGHAEGI
jgi:hypothetical protein